MKSKIILIPTRDMTKEEWLRFRFGGIGASEVSTVMGLNRWKSSIALFYEKLGEVVFDVHSLAAFLGKEREEFLGAMWEAWDPRVKDDLLIPTMIANYQNGVAVRRCKRINAYCTNPDYPWLFASLDFEINKHWNKDNGALECKEISGYEADKWVGGMPPGYVVQVNTQMGVCEYSYAEVAILRDNNDFSVLPFEFNPTIWEAVVLKTKDFWDKVVEGRKIMTQRFEAQRNFNQAAVDELSAQLQTLEPAPDGSEAYTEFMKEKYKIARPGEMAGTLEDLEVAKKHREVSNRIKELETEKNLHANVLKGKMRDGADRMDWGAAGYVSWAANKTGTRTFLNKLK